MPDSPRVYVSAMETALPGAIRLDGAAVALIDELRGRGFTVSWTKEWRPYERIEEEIAGSAALLAIVDSTWTSATWMLHEFCFAIGHPSFTGQRIAPIPTFLFPPTTRPARDHWVWSREGPVHLESDPGRAAGRIAAALADRGEARR